MNITVLYTDLLDAAEHAARRAAEGLKPFLINGFSVTQKSSSVDRVTSADLESERLIVECVRERYPDHNVLAEEGRYRKSDSAYTWVIDPIDGTNNFIKHIPHYGISIAVCEAGKIVAAVVYDPSKEELFKAALGTGAFLNGRPVRVGAAGSLEDSLLITGFPYNRREAVPHTLQAMDRFFQKNVLDIRRLGSAALDLCYVACGRAEGYWEYTLNPWDYAAGALICREAGGTVTTGRGENPRLEKTSIVASNSLLHREILRIIDLADSLP